MKEINIQKQIQLDASQHDIVLLRNNIGAYKTDAGHYVEYGVGGKGWPDLIGILPVKITPEMVGRTVGVFIGVEVKRPKKNARAEQSVAIDAIRSRYGVAGVARSIDDVMDLIQKFKV